MKSPLSYLTSWFAPLLVRFNVYLRATKGLFDASVVLLLVTACTSSAIAMILGHLTDLGFYQGQQWAVFAGPVMLLGVSLFSAVSSVGSMVVMARMSQNVLVTLRNSFFSRAPQYQMFSIGRMSAKFVNKDTIALSGATESFMVLVRDSMLAVALLAVPFRHNWQLMLMTVFLVPASPFVLRSISLRRRLIVNASQDNVGAMHSRVEESYGVLKLVKAACSCDRDGRHFAPVKRRWHVLHAAKLLSPLSPTPIGSWCLTTVWCMSREHKRSYSSAPQDFFTSFTNYRQPGGHTPDGRLFFLLPYPGRSCAFVSSSGGGAHAS